MDTKAQCGDEAAVRPVQATGQGDAFLVSSLQSTGHPLGDAGRLCKNDS